MTDEMLTFARRHAEQASVTNVEFLKGTIEQIPLPDASVDVIISNCVIALSSDKPPEFIASARHLGLPLEEIRELLGAWEQSVCAEVSLLLTVVAVVVVG